MDRPGPLPFNGLLLPDTVLQVDLHTLQKVAHIKYGDSEMGKACVVCYANVTQ